ncbi:M14 family metallopeptidase [candidate division KSB1 bacterium]
MLKNSRKTGLVIIVFLLAVFSFSSLLAQATPPKEGQKKFWELKGYRHGQNFYRINYLREATPLREGEIDFKHYHTAAEVNYFLKKWSEEYPDLLDLYVGGISYEGREIMQVTLTNKKTGRDTDKPSMFVDANRHAGEVTAAESAFWMLHHMLTNYGRDTEITRLVDNFTFYFRIQNNPDGSELYLNTAQTLRSTVRPYDNDRDGLLDEDPMEDLDGDGFVRQMRIKVPKGEGAYVIDERDPKGRLMKRAPRGEGIYNVMSEGIDNDGDGRINEDGIGGLDLHRNYPENWRPMPENEKTGRGWTQGGAGDYPLSETETRSLVIFLLEHPNIFIMNTMDTTVPMHLRPPSTSKSEERMYPEDLKFYKEFDKKGMEISGYPWAGDVYYDYSTRGREGATGRPLFGHSPDFGYWYYGAIWYGDELWNGGRVGDYNGDGEEDDLDRLEYNDKELSKSRFQEWTKAMHPVYGEVEVGGWNPKFWRQNPPPELVEEWAIKQARFNLFLASQLPKVEISEPKIKAEKNNEYTIEVEVENTGGLPTAFLQAQLVKIVRPDVLTLEFPEDVYRPVRRGRSFYMRPQEDTPRQRNKVTFIDPKPAEAPSFEIGRLDKGEKKKYKFKVKLEDISGTKCTLRFSSTRGGVITKEIYIGN